MSPTRHAARGASLSVFAMLGRDSHFRVRPMGDPEREPLGLYVPVVILELLEAYHNSDLSIAAERTAKKLLVLLVVNPPSSIVRRPSATLV